MAEEDTVLQLEEDQAAYEEALQADDDEQEDRGARRVPLGLVCPFDARMLAISCASMLVPAALARLQSTSEASVAESCPWRLDPAAADWTSWSLFSSCLQCQKSCIRATAVAQQALGSWKQV